MHTDCDSLSSLGSRKTSTQRSVLMTQRVTHVVGSRVSRGSGCAEWKAGLTYNFTLDVWNWHGVEGRARGVDGKMYCYVILICLGSGRDILWELREWRNMRNTMQAAYLWEICDENRKGVCDRREKHVRTAFTFYQALWGEQGLWHLFADITLHNIFINKWQINRCKEANNNKDNYSFSMVLVWYHHSM